MKDSKQEIKDSKYLISHIQSQYTRFSKGQKLQIQSKKSSAEEEQRRVKLDNNNL